MSSVDQEIDSQVAGGGQQRKGQHVITKYNAEKTKSYRNAVTALCVVRNIRQRLLLLVGGHSTSRRNKLIICFSLTTLLLLRLLHDHQYRYFFTNQTRGAARVVLDYSNVKNIQDLESLRKRLDSLCFVSATLFVIVQSFLKNLLFQLSFIYIYMYICPF
jgi:hypothetical protein